MVILNYILKKKNKTKQKTEQCYIRFKLQTWDECGWFLWRSLCHKVEVKDENLKEESAQLKGERMRESMSQFYYPGWQTDPKQWADSVHALGDLISLNLWNLIEIVLRFWDRVSPFPEFHHGLIGGLSLQDIIWQDWNHLRFKKK